MIVLRINVVITTKPYAQSLAENKSLMFDLLLTMVFIITPKPSKYLCKMGQSISSLFMNQAGMVILLITSLGRSFSLSPLSRYVTKVICHSSQATYGSNTLIFHHPGDVIAYGNGRVSDSHLCYKMQFLPCTFTSLVVVKVGENDSAH